MRAHNLLQIRGFGSNNQSSLEICEALGYAPLDFTNIQPYKLLLCKTLSACLLCGLARIVICVLWGNGGIDVVYGELQLSHGLCKLCFMLCQSTCFIRFE